MKKIFAAILSVVMTVSVFCGIYFISVDADASATGDIRLSANYLGLEVNQKRTLLAYVTPSRYSDDVIWSTSDSSVAHVSSTGLITAVSTGNAKITATVEEIGEIATCNVYVLNGDLRGNFNFSESNLMSNLTWEDTYPTYFTTDDGGNTSMALSYLTRWDGPVFEEDDRFPSSMHPDDIVYRELDPEYHLQEAIFIPSRNNYRDNDNIKEALVKYGAVYGAFVVDFDCFDYQDKTYYLPDYISPDDGGHAITIVGWDDDFSASNFVYTPPGDGAFICKNSWGTSSGYNGFFYISYYDSYIGFRDIMTAYTGLEPISNYNKMYQYDPYGLCEYLGGDGESTMYAANVFPESSRTLSSNEELSAVSFYTIYENTSYEIFVVPDYNGRSSLDSRKISVDSGVLEESGYFTIEFDPVTVEAGNRFAVIVKLTVEGEDAVQVAEMPYEYYSDYARANSNESFFSYDGEDWDDITDYIDNCNFCIKAFTNTTNGYRGSPLSGIDNDNREYESDKVYTVNEMVASGRSNLTPEFVEYINSLDDEKSKAQSEGERKLSAIPSPVSIKSSANENDYACYLPSRFFLGDEGCVTSVKDQGYTSGCWAFSTLASMESCLLRNASNLTSIPSGGNQKTEIDAIIAASNVKLNGISLTETHKEVNVEDRFTLEAEPSPINAKMDDVIWSSSNTSIATVCSHGVVTAIRPGSTTITAKTPDNAVSSSCTVNVNARTFCITWDVDGTLYTQLVPEFSPIVPNVEPEKTGYTFTGWSPALPEYMPSENVVFTATWSINSYNLTFDATGGTFNDGNSTKVIRAEYNSRISEPETPTRAGYDFAGWDSYIPSRMPAQNLTIRATWTPRNDTRYTVKTYIMKADGQYAVTSETFYGTTEETVTTSYNGNIGTGMFLNTSRSVLSGQIAGDGSLVLSIYIDRYKYSLITIADDDETTTEYYYGQTVTQPQDPVKPGFSFMGWTPEIPATMPNHDVTVHAVFEKNYTLSIKNNPGRRTVKFGDTLVLTAIHDGLPEGTVISWYMNGSGFSGQVSEDGFNCYLTATGSGSAEITAIIEYPDGTFYENSDGSNAFDQQTITANAGFFQKIISFFKNLFGMNRYVVQNIVKLSK